MHFTHFIGIDVSKDTLDFAVVLANKVLFHQQVSNDKKGIAQFLKELHKQTKTPVTDWLFCLEHTGIYNNPLLNALRKLAAPIWVERAAHIKKSLGLSRGKTDKLDSKRIALFAYKNRDDARLWAPPRPIIQELDRLTAQRARLNKAIKILKTPLSKTEGFIATADRKANQQACDQSLKAPLRRPGQSGLESY